MPDNRFYTPYCYSESFSMLDESNIIGSLLSVLSGFSDLATEVIVRFVGLSSLEEFLSCAYRRKPGHSFALPEDRSSAGIMLRCQKAITLNYLPGGEYLLTWEESGNMHPQQHLTTLQAVEREFPAFCAAICQCEEELSPVVPVEDLLIVGAYTYAETINAAKRFQVYRHLAWVLGWHERTQLPLTLESAIKDTWHDVDEVHVGFVPNKK